MGSEQRGDVEEPSEGGDVVLSWRAVYSVGIQWYTQRERLYFSAPASAHSGYTYY